MTQFYYENTFKNTVTASTLCTDRAGVQPRPQLKPVPRTLTSNHTATRSPGLPFNGLHPRNPCNYTDYYSLTIDSLSLVGWPTVESLLTKLSPANHSSRTGQVQVRESPSALNILWITSYGSFGPDAQ